MSPVWTVGSMLVPWVVASRTPPASSAAVAAVRATATRTSPARATWLALLATRERRASGSMHEASKRDAPDDGREPDQVRDMNALPMSSVARRPCRCCGVGPWLCVPVFPRVCHCRFRGRDQNLSLLVHMYRSGLGVLKTISP